MHCYPSVRQPEYSVPASNSTTEVKDNLNFLQRFLAQSARKVRGQRSRSTDPKTGAYRLISAWASRRRRRWVSSRATLSRECFLEAVQCDSLTSWECNLEKARTAARIVEAGHSQLYSCIEIRLLWVILKLLFRRKFAGCCAQRYLCRPVTWRSMRSQSLLTR